MNIVNNVLWQQRTSSTTYLDDNVDIQQCRPTSSTTNFNVHGQQRTMSTMYSTVNTGITMYMVNNVLWQQCTMVNKVLWQQCTCSTTYSTVITMYMVNNVLWQQCTMVNNVWAKELQRAAAPSCRSRVNSEVWRHTIDNKLLWDKLAELLRPDHARTSSRHHVRLSVRATALDLEDLFHYS